MSYSSISFSTVLLNPQPVTFMPPTPLSTDTWTAGAQRVWAATLKWAVAQSARELAVEHLLGGLVSEESRAAEQLERVGITQPIVEKSWGTARRERIAAIDSLAESESIPRHELLELVLIEARTQAYQEGPGTELGTEHLLFGLSRVPSEVSHWLKQFGIAVDTSDVAQKRAALPRSDETPVPAPVPPELELNWHDPTQTELFEVYRILDAAANRAREGLRVVEDFARWAWNDGFLSQQLKECRHELTETLRRLPQPALLSARDTEHDVGTEIRTNSEYRRESPAAAAVASFKRVQEALRSLEEYSKILDTDLATRFEQLRYRLYTLDKAVHTTNAARSRLAGNRLCLLATNSLCHHGLGPAILGALEAGVRMIQLREKSLPDRELLELAGRVRQWTNDFDAIFIMNDRPDLAALANADGIHVGQDDITVAAARKLLGPEKLVGVSTHSIEQARQAVLDGADYLGVGPVFPSSTKEFTEFPGLEFVQQVAAEIPLPWFAIGGVNAENLSDLISAGATRIAVSSTICSAEEPSWSAAELLGQLSR